MAWVVIINGSLPSLGGATTSGECNKARSATKAAKSSARAVAEMALGRKVVRSNCGSVTKRSPVQRRPAQGWRKQQGLVPPAVGGWGDKRGGGSPAAPFILAVLKLCRSLAVSHSAGMPNRRCPPRKGIRPLPCRFSRGGGEMGRLSIIAQLRPRFSFVGNLWRNSAFNR
jgi:hypothetical protein